MVRRLVVFAFIASLFNYSAWASQASTSPSASQWVVGARPFVLSSSRIQNDSSLTDLTTTIPTLILENLADAGVRILLPEEMLQRQLAELYSQRTTLASSLTSAIKERDRQLFLAAKDSQVRKKVREKDKEVVKFRSQLEEKDKEIAEVRELIRNREFSKLDETRETVVLWQADSGKLFEQEKVGKEAINGLLSGEVLVSGNYLSVRVSLSIYPGDLHGVEIRSASSLAELTSMCQEIARQLKPVLQNRPTVLVEFDIMPGEAAEQARLLVDGQVFQLRHLDGGEILLPAGSHSIVVESEGFYPKSFTGDFTGSDNFLAEINLIRVDSRQVEFSSERIVQENVYINGLPAGKFNQEVEVSTGLVFGAVLPTPLPKSSQEEPVDSTDVQEDVLVSGEIEGEDGGMAAEAETTTPVEPAVEVAGIGSPYYFVADVKPGQGLLQLNVRLKRDTDAISSRIEKRRRVMYNSYSALLLSLVPYFISSGMYVNMSNGWRLGHEDEKTVKMWKSISTGSMILSAGLGLNFAVQMGLFLGAADSVLPEWAKSR